MTTESTLIMTFEPRRSVGHKLQMQERHIHSSHVAKHAIGCAFVNEGPAAGDSWNNSMDRKENEITAQ